MLQVPLSTLRRILCIVFVLSASPLPAFAESREVPQQEQKTGETAPSSEETPPEDFYEPLRLFGDALMRVYSDYVEVPENKELIEAAINGMLMSLDPHSSYLSPEEFEDMQVQTKGEFGGLGIEVTMEDGFVKVITPIDDTPAYEAGVFAGDIIAKLDGESLQGIPLNEAVERMRGEPGTKVTLTIIRKGIDTPLEITITRDIIKIRSVRSEFLEDVGYIRVTQFTEQTLSLLKQAFEELKKASSERGEDLKGYILDLRNNPGGLLNQAISVSDAFLDRGEIVSVRGRLGKESQRFNAGLGDLSGGKPVIVLINGGSASASEIVAGALQDHRRATVLGTRSFGKGSVQSIIPLRQKSAIRLTTALYFTPSNVSIQAKGIEPDIEVYQKVSDDMKAKIATLGESDLRGHIEAEEGEEVSGSQAYIPRDKKDDTQLNYAMDLLRGKREDEAFPPNPMEDLPFYSGESSDF